MNKRANLAYNWVEYLFIVLAVIGMLVSISIKSAPFSYIVIVICGFLCGRLIFKFRKSKTLPLYLIMFGFLLGYVIGSYYSSRRLIVVLFVIANFVGYHLHEKGHIKF